MINSRVRINEKGKTQRERNWLELVKKHNLLEMWTTASFGVKLSSGPAFYVSIMLTIHFLKHYAEYIATKLQCGSSYWGKFVCCTCKTRQN